MPLYECPFCGKKYYYPVRDKAPKCNCRKMRKIAEKEEEARREAEAKSGKKEAESLSVTRTGESKWFKGAGIEGEK